MGAMPYETSAVVNASHRGAMCVAFRSMVRRSPALFGWKLHVMENRNRTLGVCGNPGADVGMCLYGPHYTAAGNPEGE